MCPNDLTRINETTRIIIISPFCAVCISIVLDIVSEDRSAIEFVLTSKKIRAVVPVAGDEWIPSGFADANFLTPLGKDQEITLMHIGQKEDDVGWCWGALLTGEAGWIPLAVLERVKSRSLQDQWQ